jgi:hypothetical protein
LARAGSASDALDVTQSDKSVSIRSGFSHAKLIIDARLI